jgi:hypothetical protein
MKALIDPQHAINYVTSWRKHKGVYYPVITVIPNAARVCQVELDENVFGVAESLFWQDCSEEIIADRYYFDLETKQFISMPDDLPYPSDDQPIVEGTQTI